MFPSIRPFCNTKATTAATTTTTTKKDGLVKMDDESVNCIGEGLKKEERDRILRRHNDLRQKILDAIAELPLTQSQLQWDHRLEKEAQK